MLQRKQLTVFIANDKYQAFKQKLEFWKFTVPAVMNLTAFQNLKAYLMRFLVIAMNVIFLMLHNEMCQHLEDLCNSVDQ